MLGCSGAPPVVWERVERDRRAGALTRRQPLAAVVGLLDKPLTRVGNDEYARQNRSFGLTTLRRRHVQVDGALLRSEEHTSELQSRSDLVCRLLLEKKKKPT